MATAASLADIAKLINRFTLRTVNFVGVTGRGGDVESVKDVLQEEVLNLYLKQNLRVLGGHQIDKNNVELFFFKESSNNVT